MPAALLEVAESSADWLGRRSHRFWACVIVGLGAFIYLPYLGSFPFWDPWEPHYTQVAWEMAERDTWLNPYYRGLDNWWSKPILMLWMLRASLALFWNAATDFANNEWAARLPFALTAIAGGVLQYDWVRRLFGRTAGVLAGIILLTAPQYLLVGRQVMADVPFLVTYGASLGYLAVGLFTPRVEAAAKAGPGWFALARHTWSTDWPFIAFWVLQALSVLSKGFVAPTLAVLVLAGYWAATLRWQDHPVPDGGWGSYVRRQGWVALVIMAATVALAYRLPVPLPEQRNLYQALFLAAGALVAALVVLRELPPMRHARHLLTRIGAAWGLPLFFAVAAPWFIYMTVLHGWPYWNEFIYYHHLGRAAGTIDKPGGTFDYFVRQLGVALFPWSAFVFGALWKFLGRASHGRSIAERRNLFVLLAAALPYLFFTLAGTKFAHYIMPVLPMLAAMLAVTLAWLGRDEERPALAEAAPPLAGAVPAYSDAPSPWWQHVGARGDLVVFTAVSLITFGILAHDLVIDFRLFLRLFVYYFNRDTPFDYQPFIVLQVIFFPIGVIIGLGLLSRFVGRWHLAGLATGAVVLACYLGWVTMPAMGLTYSYKPFYFAYEQLHKPGEPIGQYNDWQQPERSVIFLFQNRCEHLRTDAQAAAFLKRPGRKFVLVDRDRLADIRRVAKEAGTPLFVVFDGHPYARLLSDQPNPEAAAKMAEHVLKEIPSGIQRADAEFEGKIRLVGWSVEPSSVKPGGSVQVSLYFQGLQLMNRDWQIFIHGDGPHGGANRIHLDHFPVEGLYPTSEWQEGEIVRDTFSVPVPADYPFEYFDLWTGFYVGNQRMTLSNNPPNDGFNRVRGPRISVLGD